ncbi:hypothetical protein BpHYR1_020854 [Brachionus plicatilis]|uniref:Uncharacterized protein n=1 Tax=Brachionus plicatilis TaxID=10195 RepID=A0A3M7R2Y8_BRAPC|nr:hypothetical protein BpHYR1_020854 [Brachionus plicatilis]
MSVNQNRIIVPNSRNRYKKKQIIFHPSSFFGKLKFMINKQSIRDQIEKKYFFDHLIMIMNFKLPAFENQQQAEAELELIWVKRISSSRHKSTSLLSEAYSIPIRHKRKQGRPAAKASALILQPNETQPEVGVDEYPSSSEETPAIHHLILHTYYFIVHFGKFHAFDLFILAFLTVQISLPQVSHNLLTLSSNLGRLEVSSRDVKS